MPAALGALSPAEQQVLVLLLQGKSNKAIATARGTPVRTVTKQVEAVFSRLGVRSRAELCLRVQEWMRA